MVSKCFKRFINGLAYVSILFVTVVQRNCDGFSPSYNLGGYGNVGSFFALNPWAAMKFFFTYSSNSNQFKSPSPSFLTKETPSPGLRDLGFQNIGPIKVIRKNELLENFQPPRNESDLSSKHQISWATFGPFRIIRKEQLVKLFEMSHDPIILTKALLRYFSKTISEKVSALNYETNKLAALRNFFSCIDESLLLTSTCGTESHTTSTPPSSTPSTSTSSTSTSSTSTFSTPSTSTSSTSTSSTSTSSTSTSSTSTSSTSTSSTSTTTATPITMLFEKCADLVAICTDVGMTIFPIETPADAATYCPAVTDAQYCYAGATGSFSPPNLLYTWPDGTTTVPGGTNWVTTGFSINGNHTCLVWTFVDGAWRLTNLTQNASNGGYRAIVCQ